MRRYPVPVSTPVSVVVRRLISRHVVLGGGRFVSGRGYMRDGGGGACVRYRGGQRTARATLARGHRGMGAYGLGGFCGRSGRVRVGFDGGSLEGVMNFNPETVACG